MRLKIIQYSSSNYDERHITVSAGYLQCLWLNDRILISKGFH